MRTSLTNPRPILLLVVAAALALVASLAISVPARAVPAPGPDAFGYTTGPIASGFEDISATGTATSLGNDDTTIKSLGFSFLYYGALATQVELSSNGFLSLAASGTTGCCQGQIIPSSSAPNAVVAAMWSDLVQDASSEVYYQTLGIAPYQRFITQWDDLEFFGDSASSATFQIVLYESSNIIELHYEDVKSTTSTNNQSVGIEDFTGTDGIQLAFGTNLGPSLANFSHRFEPPIRLTGLAFSCLVYDSTETLDGPLVPGTPRAVQVSGLCDVEPGATAVVLTATAVNSAGVGNLRLSAAGTAPAGGVVNYINNGLNNTNTVTVPLNAAGQIDVAAHNSGTDVRLVALGFYSSWGTGRFVPLTPCAVADSRSGTGFFAGPFAAGAAYPDVDVVGTFSADQGGGNTDCLVPIGAVGVLVNVVSIGGSGGTGGLAVGLGLTEPTEPTTNFAAIGLNNAAVAGVLLPPFAPETIAVNIIGTSGTPTTHVRLVILGYFTQITGVDLSTVNPCTAFDSRTTVSGDTNIPTGVFAGKRDGGSAMAGPIPGSTTYNVTGAIPAEQGGELDCAVPEGASAVLINLVAIDAGAIGNFRAYATGSSPTGGVLNFTSLTPPMNNSNAVVVPLSAAGNMDLFVNAPSQVGLPVVHARGVILGYYE